MRGFLFDENLPRVPSLQTGLPVTHALDLGPRPTDSQLWGHAQQHDLAIVTKDADFSQRIVLSVPPPRVIHLRVGNMRGRAFAAWLESTWPQIESAIATHKLVNVYRDRIEAVKWAFSGCFLPPVSAFAWANSFRWKHDILLDRPLHWWLSYQRIQDGGGREGDVPRGKLLSLGLADETSRDSQAVCNTPPGIRQILDAIIPQSGTPLPYGLLGVSHVAIEAELLLLRHYYGDLHSPGATDHARQFAVPARKVDGSPPHKAAPSFEWNPIVFPSGSHEAARATKAHPRIPMSYVEQSFGVQVYSAARFKPSARQSAGCFLAVLLPGESHVEGDGIGIRGGAAFHMSAISAGVRS